MRSTILFQTLVGAHLWRMEHPGSDYDVFECYLADTADILQGLGREATKSTFSPKVNGDKDIARHELQVVVEMLLKGNINFVLGVMSPIVWQTSPWHESLRAEFYRDPPRNIYHSLRGMAVHNVKLYGDMLSTNPKKANTILRLLNFGIEYLKTGSLVFSPVDGQASQIMGKLTELDLAATTSGLTPKMDEERLRRILSSARITQMGESPVDVFRRIGNRLSRKGG